MTEQEREAVERVEARLAGTINGVVEIPPAELEALLSLVKRQGDGAVTEEWQPIETAPKDGSWILLRGRNSAGYPMIPVVCAWCRGGSVMNELAWRDSASGRDVGFLIQDVPLGSSADWRPLPAPPVMSEGVEE